MEEEEDYPVCASDEKTSHFFFVEWSRTCERRLVLLRHVLR